MAAFSINLLSNRRRPETKKRQRITRRRLASETLEARHLLATITVDFSDLNLFPESHWNGPDPFGSNQPDPFGGSEPVVVGRFRSGWTEFSNSYNLNYGNWAGFAYSNETDATTPGFGNEFGSFAGGGLEDQNFGVAYVDQYALDPFNPAEPTHLAKLPSITLPPGVGIESAFVTNTTYAALSMRDGDGFAKQFGGVSGDDPDWYKLTAYGTDVEGDVVAAVAAPEIFLADYQNPDNTQDYILDTWAQLDLSPLAGARRIYFHVSSSDTGAFGMNTPAYFAIDNITFTNTAPVLNSAITPQLTSIDEDTPNSPGVLVSDLLFGAVTDPDQNALQGMAIIGASSGGGDWQYTLNGSTWLDLGSPSETEARLLPSNGLSRLRFVPDPNFSGELTISYRAWDQTQGFAGSTLDTFGRIGGAGTFSVDIATATQRVDPVNDAPVLDASFSPSFPTILEDAKASTLAGTLVADLVEGAITDIDPGALKGIGVIVASNANGTWQFTLNGNASQPTWQPLGAVAQNNAQLLPADSATRIRFVPKLNFHGEVSLTFQAWDRTEGTAGGTLDTAGRIGGTRCFSLEYNEATLTVLPVNDAPVLDPTPARTFGEIWEDAKNPTGTLLKFVVRTGLTDVDDDALPGIGVTRAWTGNGVWQFSTGSVTPNWQAIGEVSESAARLLPIDDTTRMRFVPKANYNGPAWIRFRGWDRTLGAVGGLLSTQNRLGGTKTFSLKDEAANITVKPINDAPVISLGGTIGYVRDKSPIVLAPFAKVTDVDSPNFANGRLTVRIVSGKSNSNLIELGAGFTVDDDFRVRQGNTIIGTVNPGGGDGTTNLVVTFRNTATKAVVQQLVRSITFRTIGGTAGTRVVKFSVSDGDGGISAEATKTVNVK